MYLIPIYDLYNVWGILYMKAVICVFGFNVKTSKISLRQVEKSKISWSCLNLNIQNEIFSSLYVTQNYLHIYVYVTGCTKIGLTNLIFQAAFKTEGKTTVVLDTINLKGDFTWGKPFGLNQQRNLFYLAQQPNDVAQRLMM